MKLIDFLMTGEGPTDYGQKKYGSDTWEEGPAAVLVRKCAEEVDADITITFVDRKEVEDMKLGRNIKGLSGKAIPSRRFYMLMKERGFNNGIYYCDADRESGKHNTLHQAEERFETVYEEVNQGANPETSNATIIPMIALRMIESWLMADDDVFQRNAKSGKRGKNVLFPQKPELLRGDKRNPNSDYPKNYLNRICCSWFGHEANRYIYVMIANESSTAIIAKKCPISFWQISQ